MAFIDAMRSDGHAVESICRVLPIAPSTYHRHRQRHADPTRRAARAHRDATLRVAIQYLSMRYTDRLAEAGIASTMPSPRR